MKAKAGGQEEEREGGGRKEGRVRRIELAKTASGRLLLFKGLGEEDKGYKSYTHTYTHLIHSACICGWLKFPEETLFGSGCENWDADAQAASSQHALQPCIHFQLVIRAVGESPFPRPWFLRGL